MSPYFKALLVYMFVFSIAGIMFDGLDTGTGAGITVLLSTLAAAIVWFLSSRATK